MPLPKEYLDRKLEKLPKKWVKRILRQTYNIFNEGEWSFDFKFLNGKCGVMNPEDNTITIDPRRDVVPTVIHECLHIRYPTLKEKQVRNIELCMVNSMSIKQFRQVLVKLIEVMR